MHFFTEETRKKISKTLKGRHVSPNTEFKKGMIPYIKLHSEIAPRGENHWNWKGGTRKRGVYIQILFPTHPFADGSGYIMEHRLVMEKMLGRYLNSIERVHHINGIKDDNRKENLMYFRNENEHQKFHNGGLPG